MAGRRGETAALSIVRRPSQNGAHGHLSVVASSKVNGWPPCPDLTRLFHDFDALYPGKIVNMTNDITPALAAGLQSTLEYLDCQLDAW